MRRDKALRIIRAFEDCVREDEIRGSLHPDDREGIHSRYKVLRERLLITLLELKDAPQ